MKNLVNLRELKLCLLYNNLGKYENNMKYLGEIWKQFSKLEYLELDFSDNKLGENEKCMNYLGESLKNLSCL